MIFNLNNDQAKLEVIESRMMDAAIFKGTNFLVLLLAVLVASIGLNVNSIPVIIGAMLISPLMGPSISSAFFIIRNDFSKLKIALSTLIIFFIISVLISTIYFFLSPIKNPSTELLNRINPTIWDAFIGFLGGMAGAISITRKEFNNVFPGVAIATSLMPPLCTMGFGIASMDLNIAINAFYLFFLNSFFIAVATLVTLHLMHIPEIQLEKNIKIKHYIVLISVACILTIPGFYKGEEIIKREIFDIQTSNIIYQLKNNNIVLLSQEIDKVNKILTLTLVEDEKLSQIDFSNFQKNYKLNINLIEKQKEFDINQLKKEINQEILNTLNTQENNQEIKFDKVIELVKIVDSRIVNIYFLDDKTIIDYGSIQNLRNINIPKDKIEQVLHLYDIQKDILYVNQI